MPLWASLLLGLGVPVLGIAGNLWWHLRRMTNELAALREEIRLNVRHLEALRQDVLASCVRTGDKLDFIPPNRVVRFFYTHYRACLPLDSFPPTLAAEIRLFYEKLERTEDYWDRVVRREDVAPTVQLSPPGPLPVTPRRMAAWELLAVSQVNIKRGEALLQSLHLRCTMRDFLCRKKRQSQI